MPLAQVTSQLQTLNEPIRLLCAREQAGEPMEVHLPGMDATSSSECCAYEHKQHIQTAAPAPTAAYMQHLIESMNGNSSAGGIADQEVAAQAAPDLIHQLYEWIGGTSCSLQGTPSTYGSQQHSHDAYMHQSKQHLVPMCSANFLSSKLVAGSAHK